jgi:polyhydroxyalkanoate synthesis regulator protein
MSDLHTIKKYKNRKLYSMRDSKYVTMNDLVTEMLAGNNVKIIDATNGDDITVRTMLAAALLQIDDAAARKLLTSALASIKTKLNQNSIKSLVGEEGQDNVSEL